MAGASERMRRAAAAVLVAGLVVSVAPARAAEAPAPFAFAKTEGLSTNCVDLRKGVDVVIRNETAATQPLNVALGAVADEDGAVNAGQVCGGLTVAVTEPAAGVKAAPPDVPPGGEAIVTLRAAATPSSARTYTTNLVAFADSGPVARRAVSISEQKPTGSAAVPLIKSREVSHQRYNPRDSWIVWVPVKLPAATGPALEQGATLGVLAGEPGSAAVTYGDEEPRALTTTTSLVPLHINAVGAGKYSGSVDLTPKDDETGEVSLSLTAKHWWPLALVPLLIGIGLALAVQWASGYRLTKARLVGRVRDLDRVREEARERLTAAAQGARWGDFDVADADLTALQDELLEEIERRTRNKWVAIDQKIVDDLTAKVDAAESKIGALDTIRKAAPLLVSAIGKLAADRPQPNELPPLQGPDLDLDKPRLVSAAGELLDGSALSPEDLAERATGLTATTAAVRALREYDQALAHYWRLGGVLERDLPAGHGDAVMALKRRLEGLRHALWDAASVKDVDAASKGFDKVREAIEELWPYLPDAPPLVHVQTRRVLPPLFAEALGFEAPSGDVTIPTRYFARPAQGGGAWVLDDVDSDLALLAVEEATAPLPPAGPAPPGAPPAAGPAPPAPPPPPSRPPTQPMTDAEADRVVKAARTTQRIVVGVSLAVAVVTAVGALYVGKAWGTTWDYIFAGAWGLTTQAVVTAIAAAIGGLGALAAVKQGLGAPRL